MEYAHPPTSADVFDAKLYCLLHTGTEGDIAFYKHLCEHQAQVLELGCGSGRVSLPLLRQGCHVVGLELDEGMLQLAHQKREQLRPTLREKWTLVQGDMRQFAFQAQFDRIIVPFNSLYCLGGEAPIRSCFERCLQHLKPGGLLAFDCYPMYRGDPPFDGLHGWLTTLKDGAESYDIYEQTEQDMAQQRFDVTYTYKDRYSRAFTYTLHHHYLFEDRFEPLLEAVGFIKIQRREGFNKRPSDGQLVFVAEAPCPAVSKESPT